jgi:hypothetical protein
MSSLLFSGKKTCWTVDGMNFYEWIEQNQINDCNFIKMDIEGGEYSVLPTMAAYLGSHRPTMHLSLHPSFLGEAVVRGVKARVRRSALRLGNTIRILKVLGIYKYAYDPLGKITNPKISSRRSRLHHRLAKASWKPVALLVVCLLSIFGIPSALVVTDQEWDLPAASSK